MSAQGAIASTPAISPTKRIIPIVDPRTGTHIKPSTPINTATKPQESLSTPTVSIRPVADGCNKEQEILQAVEYIFGDNNLPYDFFYLSQDGQSQGVPMSYILNNPMIRRLTNDPVAVQQSLKQSWLVEVQPMESDITGMKVVRHVPLHRQLVLAAQKTIASGIRKRLSRRSKTKADDSEKVVDDLQCQVCGQAFETTAGLRHHCQSRSHQDMATCDLHVLRCMDGCWQPFAADMTPPHLGHDGSRISFLTLNILFDYYYQDQICSPERYCAILEALQTCDADVIGLQEVTPFFVEMMMQQPWIQQSYFVSEVSSVTVQPFGQVILSRLPLANLQLYHINKVKTALFGHIVIGGIDHAFCVCHLVSNFSAAADIHALRQTHLDTLFWELSQRAENSFIMGDFNFGDDEGKYQLEPYMDVWKELRGVDAGHTYDVEHNILAKVTMKEDSKSRRYDRFLCNSCILKPIHIDVFGTIPFVVHVPNQLHGSSSVHTIHLSDHYGVTCICALDLPLHQDDPVPSQYSAPSHSPVPAYHDVPAQAHAYNHSHRHGSYDDSAGFDSPYSSPHSYDAAGFTNYGTEIVQPSAYPPPPPPPYADPSPPQYHPNYHNYNQYQRYSPYQYGAYPHFPQQYQTPEHFTEPEQYIPYQGDY